MSIDFTLTKEQQELQATARAFAAEHLAPVASKIDAEPDPFKGWQMAKPAYAEACRQGITFSMLPKEYGGGGLSNVDFVIAAEEIQAVDPGFGTAVLVNELGLMPVWYYGTEEQKQRFIGGATFDTSGPQLRMVGAGRRHRRGGRRTRPLRGCARVRQDLHRGRT
jgi:acyl-CoA dehydrogenase